MKKIIFLVCFFSLPAWSVTSPIAIIELNGGMIPNECNYTRLVRIERNGKIIASNCATHSELIGTLSKASVANFMKYAEVLKPLPLWPVTSPQDPCSDSLNRYYSIFNHGTKILLYSDEACIRKRYPGEGAESSDLTATLDGVYSLLRLRTYKVE